MERKQNKYTGEQKEKIIKDMIKNNRTKREIIEKYGMAKNTLRNWEKIYEKDGTRGLYEERRGLATKETSERKGRPMEIGKKVENDLHAKIERLEMENEYLKKLTALVQKREKSQTKIDYQ
jgi:transposase